MSQLVKLFADTFLERRDVKAVQQRNGSYMPEHTPWTPRDVKDHIAGRRTLGHYLLAPGDTTRVIAFDIDLKNAVVPWDGNEAGSFSPRAAWQQHRDGDVRPELTRTLQLLAMGIAFRLHKTFDGIPVAIAYSGNKGVHVYGLPGESIPAKIAVSAASSIMESFAWKTVRGKHFWASDMWPTVEVETFPKQSSLEGKDLGNLMRLPLGLNRKSGERCFFVRVQPSPTEFHELDPEVALSGEEVPWAEIR